MSIADIAWEGDSLEIIRGFPTTVKRDLGFALRQLQEGRNPSTLRRMESIGPGIYEIREQDDHGWYRLIYLSRIYDLIHVLHCFSKQSAKTDERDLEKARKRLVAVRARILDRKRNAKHRHPKKKGRKESS